MKPPGSMLVVVLCAALLSGQSVPNLRFNGHTLGETPEIFFSTATMMESKGLTKEYCYTLLNDAEAMRRYEASKTGLNKKDFLLSDVGGCQNVMTALRGERAPVGARFASELGKGGSVVFAGGKLMSFTLSADSPYPDIVADMKKRLGEAGHKYSAAQVSDGMRWEVDKVEAVVSKLKYHDDTVIYVGFAGASSQ